MTTPSMASPRAVREALDALGIRPRKRWGQHFLIDSNTVDRVMDAAALSPADAVLEIGPGLGVLTDRLAEVAQAVVAVEIDPKLASWLSQRYVDKPHVQIVPGDSLKMDWTDLVPVDGHWHMLGNLPYNITAPLLDRLIEHRERVDRAVWMVQREVGEKLLAPPGTRETSSLGILVQAFCRVERSFNVSKNAFYPPPDVESVVLNLTPREAPTFRASEAAFRRAIRAAFGVRRKTLRRALSVGLDISPADASGVLDRAEVDPRRRGETLTLAEFDRLAEAIESALDFTQTPTEERKDTPPRP
ncbi:MAG: 16S rRNA (adenine(1518)-N(6)/adenine(1519)-N(6))-dimethyltransferase RsmA [Halobacteriales archaeon]|nr:16S rRNA (adenine(1518)-N(6)/adenine(1519)-N(6))-dimethyltransferase RsmA [Halobacteriales archaeon]